MWQKFMYEADRYFTEVDFTKPEVLAHYDPFFRSTYAVAPTSTTAHYHHHNAAHHDARDHLTADYTAHHRAAHNGAAHHRAAHDGAAHDGPTPNRVTAAAAQKPAAQVLPSRSALARGCVGQQFVAVLVHERQARIVHLVGASLLQ